MDRLFHIKTDFQTFRKARKQPLASTHDKASWKIPLNLKRTCFQVVKQLAVFEDKSANFSLLQEAVGVMQHHDAITGTEKQHVADDYHRLLSKAVQHSIDTSGELIM